MTINLFTVKAYKKVLDTQCLIESADFCSSFQKEQLIV